ncbi:GOLPH3/VPS74 family protein [Rhodococcus aerolatus]
MPLALPDELCLLGHDAESGRAHTSHLDLGLAGAVLVELALSGRVDVDDDRVVVLDDSPTGDALLDAALVRIAEDKPRKPADWVSRLQKGLRDDVLARLVEAGVLDHETSKTLGMFTRHRWREVDPEPEQQVRARLETVVLHGTEPDQRTAALVGLVAAVDLRQAVFPLAPRKPTETRMGEVAEGEWAPAAVVTAVRQVQAAIIAATLVATTAATTSS